MKRRGAWKEKRKADAAKIAEMRNAVPVTSEEFRAKARAHDDALLVRTRGWLERYPDHSNVPIWNAVLEKGYWGEPEWREASVRTKAIHEQAKKAPDPVQGDLFG